MPMQPLIPQEAVLDAGNFRQEDAQQPFSGMYWFMELSGEIPVLLDI